MVGRGAVVRDEVSATVRRAVREVAERGQSARRVAMDPVNVPMIRHWLEAMGDGNPVYLDPDVAGVSVHGGPVAPPAMVQVWTMYGLRGERPADDPLGAMVRILDDAGFTSVVATNCDQTYHRYLGVGERVSVASRLGEVVGPKRTSLGEGWFVTTLSTWYVGDEPVAEMMFRVLKFRPAGDSANRGRDGKDQRLRPVDGTGFFWDGLMAGELRIQRCMECGELRHPPGVGCARCGGGETGHVLAAGTGEVYSFVVHHHPPVPGRAAPYVVALVELDEGVRMMGELVGVAPDEVRIGSRVRVGFERVDDELVLPVWGAL